MKSFNYSDWRVGQGNLDRESSNVNFFPALFGCVLCILLVFSIIHSGQTLTFESFLNFLASSASTFDVTYVDHSITSDWFAFNFLRNFLNVFIAIFNVAVYVCEIAYSILKFLLGLFQFIFG